MQKPSEPKDPARRRALAGVAAALAGLLVPRGARAIGDHARFRFARLALPGLLDVRPTALKRLSWELERRSSLVTNPEPLAVAPADAELFRNPLLVLSGDRAFALPPPSDVARLRRHLTYGGFLLVDSAEGRASGPFDDSVRRLLAAVLPGELPSRIPDEHVLLRSFYILHGAPGRILAAPALEGVERDRRLVVVYSQNDLLGAYARDGFGRWEHDVVPGGEGQREAAFRLGVNVVMYALCLDYKEEQAHIDYIMKTRRQPRFSR